MRNQLSKRIRLLALAAALTGLLIPAISSADPLLMTGTMTVQQTAEHTLRWGSVAGGSFGGGDIVGSGATDSDLPIGVRGGDTYSLYVDTSRIGANRLLFTAGGTSYQWGGIVGASSACTNCSFLISIVGEPILMPAVTDFSILELSTPVSMSGELKLCSSPGLCQVNTPVHGQGIINLSFHGSAPVDRWVLLRGDVTLTAPLAGGGEGGAPVPEPASLLLLASGVAGLSRWGRKKS